MNPIEFLQDNLLLLDGGMGTLLQAAGLPSGEQPERWNLTHPDAVCDIHRAYFEAGSNVVMTNTFGANTLHFTEEELDEIVPAAVENARRARESARAPQEKFIALDIGPLGRLLRPFGDFDFEEAVEVFARTVRIGCRAGVDLVCIETMSDSYETKAALLAVKENTDLPVFVTNAYGTDGKLLTGSEPEAMVALLEGMGADAIGVNCSRGPRELAAVVRRYLACASVPILFKPNAGLPRECDGQTVFDVAPEEFAEEVATLVAEGVRGVGGCCGTTPDYIRQLRDRLAGSRPLPITEKNTTCVSSYARAVSFGDAPILIGERINPTGKKRFKQALLEHDIDYILSEGLRQQDCGAHILDVNVGLPEINEAALLPEVICELQAVTPLPLQIDTSSPAAMERALRLYNGKPLVNSVCGKRESMDAIFPLVRKYGGVVVALTLDERGIPDTVEGRVEIAARIIATAESYGIDRRDLIFDTLAMTVSADPQAAAVTLGALRCIRERFGVHTSLGVSNISFGLPERGTLNSTFFVMALENGLSAAIINPSSPELMKAYRAYRALCGMDENFAEYIAHAETAPAGTAVPAPSTAPLAKAPASPTDAQATLRDAIVTGRRELAAKCAAELLQKKDPLALIAEEIIPALDEVGLAYEEKRAYLPGLLISAEAAKSAFEQIKLRAAKGGQTGGATKCPFVLATVKGDIHDIGKNIVRLLLENYGYRVCDLGRDVPPETIVEQTLALHAPLVGLSALMTTTVPSMRETIELLRRRAPFCRIVVGGAVMTAEYAARIGADHYAKDAMETVRYAEEIFRGLPTETPHP